jgi:hypothetical protein
VNRLIETDIWREGEWNIACLGGLDLLHIFASSFICLSVESLFDWPFLQVDVACFFLAEFSFLFSCV